MKPSLAGAWEKWHRAFNLFEALNVEFGSEDYFISTWGEPDADPSYYVFRVKAIPETPLRWGVMIGEIVHNFRSALDHAVCACVMLRGKSMDCRKARSQFPLLSERLAWAINDQAARRQIRHLLPAQRAVVRRYQPYKTEYRSYPFGKPHPLRLLADLSNTDKHRVLNPTFYSVNPDDAGFTIDVVDGEGDILSVPFIYDEPLKVGTEVVSVQWRPLDADAKPEVKGRVKAQVAFENGWTVEAIVYGIGGMVAAILRDLEPFFPHRKPHEDPLANRLSKHWVRTARKRRYSPRPLPPERLP